MPRYGKNLSGKRLSGLDTRHALASSFSLPRDATPQTIEATVARGMTLWNSIYQPHAVKLYNKLGDLHPDFISKYLVTFINHCRWNVLPAHPELMRSLCIRV